MRNGTSAAPKADTHSRRAVGLPLASRKYGQNKSRPNTAASTICGREAKVSAMSSEPAMIFPRSMYPREVPLIQRPRPQVTSVSPSASGRKYIDGVRAKISPPPATNSMMSRMRNVPTEVFGNHLFTMRESRYAQPAAKVQSQIATPSHVEKSVPVSKSQGT